MSYDGKDTNDANDERVKERQAQFLELASEYAASLLAQGRISQQLYQHHVVQLLQRRSQIGVRGSPWQATGINSLHSRHLIRSRITIHFV